MFMYNMSFSTRVTRSSGKKTKNKLPTIVKAQKLGKQDRQELGAKSEGIRQERGRIGYSAIGVKPSLSKGVGLNVDFAPGSPVAIAFSHALYPKQQQQ